MYNHFANNRDLTTKSGLIKGLYNNTKPSVEVDSLFMRSYDLSDVVKQNEFRADYEQTALFGMVKRHVKYFKEMLGKEKMKEI